MESSFFDIDEDEDFGFYTPVWITQPRGFVDFRTLEAERFNDLIKLHLPQEVKGWECLEDSGWVFSFEDMFLNIVNIDTEPIEIRASTETISRSHIDPLRRLLRFIAAESLVTCTSITDFVVFLLRLLEEASATIQEWKESHILKKPDGTIIVTRGKGWDVNSATALSDLYTNNVGADLSTIDTSGNDILGSSIETICRDLPSYVRILHVEPVFREDLVQRFKRRRRRMAEQLCKLPYTALQQCIPHNRFSSAADKNELIAELCRPQVTFHGTQRHVVSSIVRHGFLKPGEHIGQGKNAETLGVRCGASYGVGIYSSPDPAFALHYSHMEASSGTATRPEDIPGLRLIVCAVLMGRPLMVTRDATRRTEHIADSTANSHVSPDKLEYIVFDKAQIVPCYVIHLDWGAAKAREALTQTPPDPTNWVKKTHPRLTKEVRWPGDIEAEKKAKQAAAAKWFPYGFGPAKGTRFVIEEIGEVSEDEEDYGEYQAQRKDVDGEVEEWEERQEKSGGSWWDEYSRHRYSNKNV